MGVSMIKSVCGGTTELISGDVELTAAGDSVDFECNDECTVDDLLVNVTSGNANDAFAIQINYPSSDQTATIAIFTATVAPTAASPLSFFLNAAEGIGHSGTGKLWFRIPARGHLILKATALTSTAKVNMVALVRGGV